MKLLMMGKASPKLIKSDKAELGFLSAIVYLAPANLSGRNVCPNASPGCIAACLNTAGRGRMSSVQVSRVNKTNYFYDNRSAFLSQLRKELTAFIKKCAKAGKRAAVRLNGTSDLPWEHYIPMADFDCQFYDYTKSHRRMVEFCAGVLPHNYHLTFSRSEVNDEKCIDVLNRGGNVAVVFDKKQLPEKWQGFPVYNADETDLRFLDKPGVQGLYAKGKAKKDSSGFVVLS